MSGSYPIVVYGCAPSSNGPSAAIYVVHDVPTLDLIGKWVAGGPPLGYITTLTRLQYGCNDDPMSGSYPIVVYAYIPTSNGP